MRRLLFLPFLALAACQSPQEACLAGASRQLSIVDGLIAQTRGNLSRGYAVEEEQVLRSRPTFCDDDDDDDRRGRYFCEETEVRDVARPVAIDLRAEQAKLDGLLERRASLERQRTSQLLACQGLPDA